MNHSRYRSLSPGWRIVPCRSTGFAGVEVEVEVGLLEQAVGSPRLILARAEESSHKPFRKWTLASHGANSMLAPQIGVCPNGAEAGPRALLYLGYCATLFGS